MKGSYPKIKDTLFNKRISSKKEYSENSIVVDTKSQEELCSSADVQLFNHQKLIRNFMNPYTPYQNLLLIHAPGLGKCHGINTPILMHSGEIKMVQDIQVGESLMGDDSTPRMVLSLARGQDILYDIIQSNGDTYRVNQEHILVLKRGVDVIEISVKDYIQLSPDSKKLLKGYKAPIQFNHSVLPNIDAYTMGKLIAENETVIAKDSELLNILNEYNCLTETETPYKYRVNIPRNYLVNSRENQLELLRGLLEKESPHVEKDIQFLQECLGQSDEMLSDIDVRRVGTGNYYGFMIDNNHRYVLGDLTVTHNTITAISVAESHVSDGIKIHVLLEDSVRQNFISEYTKYTGEKLDKNIYKIHTLGKFTNKIQQLLQSAEGINKIRQEYSNTVIIVDEVHNVRESTDEDPTLKRYAALRAVVTLANNAKLLLMSATPMYDSPHEIVSLLNLFKLNNQNDLSLDDIPKISINISAIFNGDSLSKQGEKILQEELKGIVSYLKEDARTYPSSGYPDSATTYPFLKNLRLIDCVMSKTHEEFYKKHNKDMNINNVRQNSNIIDAVINTSDLTMESLSNKETSVSTKFYNLMKNIDKTPGSAFVYSEFIGTSLERIKIILEQNGYHMYSPNKTGKSFIFLEGSQALSSRSKLIDIFNSDDNKNGDVIKVVIGSRVLKEGITLKNVQSVHIMEPWHNMSRLLQIWGRAIRTCSHVVLPPRKRHVDIYLYASTFGTKVTKEMLKLPFSESNVPYDIYAYYRSEEKDISIKKVIRNLRSIAIDCFIQRKHNKNDEDTITCDNTDTFEEDTITYNLQEHFFRLPDINKIIRDIKKRIASNYVIVLGKIDKNTSYAIENIVPNMRTNMKTFKHLIKDKNDIPGYIIKRGDYLLFQPFDKNTTISLYERIHSKMEKAKNTPLSSRFIPKRPDVSSITQARSRQATPRNSMTIIADMDNSIRGNYRGIIRNGEFMLQQIENTGKNTTGRLCANYNGRDFKKIIPEIGIPNELVKNFYTETNGVSRIRNKEALCETIMTYFYPNIVTTKNPKDKDTKRTLGKYSFIMEGDIMKINNNEVVSRGGTNCFTMKVETLREIVSALEINSNSRDRKTLCSLIKDKVFDN